MNILKSTAEITWFKGNRFQKGPIPEWYPGLSGWTKYSERYNEPFPAGFEIHRRRAIPGLGMVRIYVRRFLKDWRSNQAFAVFDLDELTGSKERLPVLFESLSGSMNLEKEITLDARKVRTAIDYYLFPRAERPNGRIRLLE